MSFTSDLLQALAQRLHDAGAGVYRPSDAYEAGETAIAFTGLPPEPDRVIVLTGYGVTDDIALSDSVIGVQARFRSVRDDPLGVEDIGDAVFDVLHGAWAFWVGAIRVTNCERVSSTPMGQDANSRHERADNYYLTVHRPSPNRT